MVTIGSSDLDGPRSVDSGYEMDGSAVSSRRSGFSTRVEEFGDEPHPIQVIKTDEENHTFSLDEEALAGILLRPDVACRKVAIISVAGAFRKGKSFLLNFFLRFMQKYDQDGHVSNFHFTLYP